MEQHGVRGGGAGSVRTTLKLESCVNKSANPNVLGMALFLFNQQPLEFFPMPQ